MKLATTPAFHPSQDALERFMRGELPRAQAAVVVRHLLRGCPLCSLETRWLWRLGAETHVSAETRWPVRRLRC